MMESKGSVVLVSGGMDSSVLLHHVVREPAASPNYTLSFDYGQRHRRELECAAFQSERAGAVEHHVLDIGGALEFLKSGTALVSGGADVPDLETIPESERDQPPTYVPNRNMMLLSIAAAFAESRGVTEVYYGAQAHDEYGYWDCTADFLDAINAVLAQNRRDPVSIRAPLMRKRKSELVQMGLELGVDFARTWSCYRGGERPCGTCPTCVERAKAWEEAGEADPLTVALR